MSDTVDNVLNTVSEAAASGAEESSVNTEDVVVSEAPVEEVPEPEPVSETTEVAEPEPEPVSETTEVAEPEPVPEEVAEPEPVSEEVEEPEPEPVSETTEVAEPEPVSETTGVAEPSPSVPVEPVSTQEVVKNVLEILSSTETNVSVDNSENNELEERVKVLEEKLEDLIDKLKLYVYNCEIPEF